MTTTCRVYKDGISLGTCEATNDSTSFTSYSGTAPGTGRNVQIVVEDSGSQDGYTHHCRITNDGGTTLTTDRPFPFATA